MTHEEKQQEAADTREAIEAWQEAEQTATADEIYAGLQRALASEEWFPCPHGEGIPPMAEWLKSRGWEHTYTPAARA